MSCVGIKSYWTEGNLYFEALADAQYIRMKSGLKVHRRPTAEAFAAEIKSEFTDTDSAHAAVAVTADWKANGTAGGVQGVQGVARLKSSSYTATGGSIIGTYGQACAVGTVNGSGIMMAGLYGLIEDTGTYTAVSHVASAWLDSHLTQTVTAGSYQLLYMTNNGSTTMDQAFYIYAGNKITALMEINTASGMVGANVAGGSTVNFSNYKLIKITLDGVVHYLIAAQTIA